MSTKPRPPLGRRMLARVMSMLNVVMRPILRLPFPTPLTKRLMLVSFSGRKTGKAYQQPMSYVQQGNTLLTPGGGKWKLNLREDQAVRIRLRGQDVFARPEFVKSPEEVERLIGVMAAANPTVSAFVGIPKGPDGRLDHDRLETALKYGFMIVRWHLAEGWKPVNNENSRIERAAVCGWEPISLSLIIIDFILFASGAIAHLGVPIPLGFGTWNETFLVPAVIVEGMSALALGSTLASMWAGTTWSRRLAWWVLWYCFAGVLWGMARLAIGSIPAAHTMSNDFLHIAMTLVTTLALVRLASLRD